MLAGLSGVPSLVSSQALAQLVRAMPRHDLALDLPTASVNIFELAKDQTDALPRQFR